MSSWIVVGLCGVTNSGKTSLSKRIIERYPGTLSVYQDSYFLPIDSEKHIPSKVPDHWNWDIISALDMDKMVDDVNRIVEREPSETESGILVLDGFLLLSHRHLSSLCTIKVYLDLDFEETKRRRLTRYYDPPDPPGYFENVVWPESRKAKEEIMQSNRDMLVLSGRDTIEYNLEIICRQIEYYKNEKSR